ncbi:hypothetical protein Dsin_028726 [Dipteronia sinensis]|uniref:Protein FAR1-RELATED SEQUENCE n=1 Tax=Dipteronia sinensis TaxID=43782 RepID=A0AAD9ZR35_9ROSI|nr:hypothetical protein Dsin_028726 [Dipteronia sinensis]
MDTIGRSMLHGNAWLQSLYEMRAKWVHVFVNHVFSTGMTSSQHAETCHSFFKRAIAHQRREELIADHVDVNEKPMLKLPH